ncbi:unnamed protein product [Chironomus riparius]|uniref:receptor protein serine/threonine kinase n=1 Tax=Chironomus riparius TaxID=315576 RepID=A0A9N9WNQ0_9DIPT|nr:unnamed protein product [Chironomus riparius]
MNFLWIILLISFTKPSEAENSPRRCMHFERRRVSKSSEQEDDSRNEIQEDSEADDDMDQNYTDLNSTEMSGPATNVSCPGSQNYCFSTYLPLKDGKYRLDMQGCWEHRDICNQSTCMAVERKNVLFCCCNSDFCNANFVYTTPKTSPVIVSPDDGHNNIQTRIQYRSSAIWISFASTGIMLVVIGVVFFISCRTKPKPLRETSPLAPSGPGYSSNLYNVDNLKPISIIGEGKYGTVWKGMMNDCQPVAIKIFSANKKQYFLNEMDVYTQPFMDVCPALLKYFGCDERINSEGKIEYLLVLSLAECSLYEYLKQNSTSFPIFSRMATSIARGISHLHTRIQKADMLKMCICHRDINSRNILVKADLTCCICDYGFATKLSGSRYEYQGEMILAETKSIYEVGTLRYMAPEILEGAVNLRDCELALKQIDVYSLGLVLWELCMRCQEFYPSEMPTPIYKAPYEAEIGIHPTFDQMRALVLQHKARPLFPPQWGGGTAAHAIKEVCEDCWDPDAEARLTSLCVEERLIEISTLKPRSHYVTMSTSLSTNNKLIITANNNYNNSISSPTRDFSSAIPPNQISTNRVENTCETYISSPSNDYGSIQKNRECYGQQIQQFQGRNLCLERNLVQIHQADQSNDEIKSIKKAALCNGNQLINNPTGNDNFYNGEYEVLVEELLTKKLACTSSATSREVLQKKNNSEKKSTRWRDIIHAKFHMKRRNLNALNVENVQQSFSSPVRKVTNDIVINCDDKPNNIQRPKNLDLISPIVISCSISDEIQSYKTPLNDPNSDSFTVIQAPTKIVTSKSATLNTVTSDDSSESNQLKRQRSLEVFREVFGPSKVSLRDVQCRVKTPGDLPASVRKVRASKTLSLYDDRIMDPNEYRHNNNSL